MNKILELARDTRNKMSKIITKRTIGLGILSSLLLSGAFYINESYKNKDLNIKPLKELSLEYVVTTNTKVDTKTIENKMDTLIKELSSVNTITEFLQVVKKYEIPIKPEFQKELESSIYTTSLKNHLINYDEVIDKKIEIEIGKLDLKLDLNAITNENIKKEIIKSAYIYQIINMNNKNKLFFQIKDDKTRIEETAKLLATFVQKETGTIQNKSKGVENYDIYAFSPTMALGIGQINGSTTGYDLIKKYLILDKNNNGETNIDFTKINIDYLKNNQEYMKADYKIKTKIFLENKLKEKNLTEEQKNKMVEKFISFGSRMLYTIGTTEQKEFKELFKKISGYDSYSKENRQKILNNSWNFIISFLEFNDNELVQTYNMLSVLESKSERLKRTNGLEDYTQKLIYAYYGNVENGVGITNEQYSDKYKEIAELNGFNPTNIKPLNLKENSTNYEVELPFIDLKYISELGLDDGMKIEDLDVLNYIVQNEKNNLKYNN